MIRLNLLPRAPWGPLEALMRAFMSEPCEIHFDRCEAVNGYRSDYQSAAEREARAILRESEPDLPETDAICIERLQGSGRLDDRGRTGRFEGCVALADALAAFVELEIS